MSQPYVGEIRLVGFNFAPSGWAFCDGSQMSIAQNEVLFNLIGTTYGGDGVNTFNLPNLLGRVPMHLGGGFVQGQLAGNETVTLTTNQLPAHTHAAAATGNDGTSNLPTNNYWANWTGAQYTNTGPTTGSTMRNDAVASAGGGQPHENLIPFLAVNFIISLFGVFPSQN